jgi:hypothetical protein
MPIPNEPPYDSSRSVREQPPETTSPQSPITPAGRAFCGQLTAHFIACYDDSTVPHELWPALADYYGLRWNSCSKSRLCGGLPDRSGDTRFVRGTQRYSIKIEHDHRYSPLEYSSNWREAIVWEQALEREIDDLFAPVVAHAEDYHWLVMNDVQMISTEAWDAPKSSTKTAADGCGPRGDDRLTNKRVAHTQALAEQGLAFSTKQASYVGLTNHGTVVAVEYAHLQQTDETNESIWAGTYDPNQHVISTLADVQAHDRK